ncbi:hypothetical protein THAOC_23767, partial [Thalassiosira oceanica]
LVDAEAELAEEACAASHPDDSAGCFEDCRRECNASLRTDHPGGALPLHLAAACPSFDLPSGDYDVSCGERALASSLVICPVTPAMVAAFESTEVVRKANPGPSGRRTATARRRCTHRLGGASARSSRCFWGWRATPPRTRFGAQTSGGPRRRLTAEARRRWTGRASGSAARACTQALQLRRWRRDENSGFRTSRLIGLSGGAQRGTIRSGRARLLTLSLRLALLVTGGPASPGRAAGGGGGYPVAARASPFPVFFVRRRHGRA